MKTVWTDRSRILSYQRCPRRRYMEYHEGGMGIVPRRTPLPLAVGGAVHEGLAVLLREGQAALVPNTDIFDPRLVDIEEHAVMAALAELATHADGLDLDLSERAAQGPVDDIQKQLNDSLGQVDEGFEGRVLDAKAQFDAYLFAEQSALVEAMVRAYARRRLRPLLEQYEVLEVEREGEWLLAEMYAPLLNDKVELRFASRPDALLRDRESNQLYIQSFKTAASWDIRKERDSERDMQGLSEGVEIERRLGELWTLLKGNHTIDFAQTTEQMCKWLLALEAPPRILGIRMEYLMKGERWKDKDLTARMGIESRVQKSHLVRAYLNSGMAAGDEQWNYSYDFHKEDGSTSKLYYKTWRPAAVWEHMEIKKWIDMLDQTVETVGEEGRALGWSGPAQASGFTDGHPLDSVFHPPLVVYRNDDHLRDWFEQTEAQERAVAEHVECVRVATDDERRSKLNVLFPMYRQSCEYPTTCPFVPICYGPEHVQRDPMGTGRYKVRDPNHIQEREAQHASQD